MKKPTDVMIHVPMLTDDELYAEVASQIRAIGGVSSFERLQKNPSIMLLAYDAAQVRALNILDRINRSGYSASLIGL